MGILNKKEEFNYFECFCDVSKIANETAIFLNKSMADFNYHNVNAYVSEIHKLENNADLKRHKLSDCLAHEFIAPIEREDISLLSQRLDDVVDNTEEIMRKLYMFNVTTIKPDALRFSSYVVECSEELIKLLNEFSNFKKSKKINESIININTIENKGDSLHVKAIRELFVNDISPKEQMIWTKIYDSFEKSLDTFENIADLVNSIITKNS